MRSGERAAEEAEDREGDKARERESGFPREGVVRFIVPELPLSVGEYLFSAAAYNSTLSVAYDHHELQYSFRVSSGPQREFGLIKLKADWEIGPADKSGTHYKGLA